MVALVADAAGLGVASISQALRFMPIPAEIPGVVSLIDSQPRIRRIIEDRLGRPAADMTVAATAALAQALGQGPIGLAWTWPTARRSSRSSDPDRPPGSAASVSSCRAHTAFGTAQRCCHP